MIYWNHPPPRIPVTPIIMNHFCRESRTKPSFVTSILGGGVDRNDAKSLYNSLKNRQLHERRWHVFPDGLFSVTWNTWNEISVAFWVVILWHFTKFCETLWHYVTLLWHFERPEKYIETCHFAWALRRIARHPWFDFAVMFVPWHYSSGG